MGLVPFGVAGFHWATMERRRLSGLVRSPRSSVHASRGPIDGRVGHIKEVLAGVALHGSVKGVDMSRMVALMQRYLARLARFLEARGLEGGLVEGEHH